MAELEENRFDGPSLDALDAAIDAIAEEHGVLAAFAVLMSLAGSMAMICREAGYEAERLAEIREANYVRGGQVIVEAWGDDTEVPGDALH